MARMQLLASPSPAADGGLAQGLVPTPGWVVGLVAAVIILAVVAFLVLRRLLRSRAGR